MSIENDQPRLPQNPKRDPVMLSLLRWLSEDSTRILPSPDDEAGIKELAQAIGKSEDYTRALMTWAYGDKSASETLRILK
jgi:hypothetical protein